MKCVVDTNIINRLVDGTFFLEDLPPDTECVATHVQIDELSNTKDTERRAKLFLKFATTVEYVIPTESTVLGISRVGYSKLSDGNQYNLVKAELDSLNGGKSSNIQDALIAEVAIANGYILLTADYHLFEVANKHGCAVQYVAI